MDVSKQAQFSPDDLPLSAIVADLERKIALQTQGRIRDLRLEEVGDAVVLSGRTSTYYMKQLASQIALDESGSLTFQNSIEVI